MLGKTLHFFREQSLVLDGLILKPLLHEGELFFTSGHLCLVLLLLPLHLVDASQQLIDLLLLGQLDELFGGCRRGH